MNCKQRNKDLFKHIALGLLVLVIIYIFVDVFFYKEKTVEGMSSNEDIIDYKLDVNTWTFKPEEIQPYIKAFHDKEQAKQNSSDENSDIQKLAESVNEAQTNYNSLIADIKSKIGDENFRLLDAGLKTDPNSEYNRTLEDVIDSYKKGFYAQAKDLKKTMTTLIADMEKRRAKTTTKK